MESDASARTSKRSSRWMVVALLTAVWAMSGAGDASASHFRYGHTSWQPAAPAPANTIDFLIQNAWRRDGYFSCRNTLTLGFMPCTGPGGFPGVGDVIQEDVGGTTFNPGQGPPIGGPGGAPLWYRVTAIDPANNWLFGSALDPASLPGPGTDTLVSKTYTAPGNYVAFIDSAARISATQAPNRHLNNPDGGYRVETLVNVGGGNRSPVSTLTPIVLCPINALCTFAVPAVAFGGDVLAYRLSTPAEASSFPPSSNYLGFSCAQSFCQPGPPFAPNAASISSSGVYTWNTTGAQLGGGLNTLYSTQVTIEARTPAGALRNKVALDFLIQLVPSVGRPPVFDTPPTPACGSTQTTTVGGTLSFTVQASDPDAGDVVTLNAVGLPPGATMTPPLPTSGNPVSSAFSWTPAAAGTFVVTFSATDQTFQQALCSITVEATAIGPPATLELQPDPDTNTAGDQHCVTATVRDAQGNSTPGITVNFSVSGVHSNTGAGVTDANGQAVFCYTGTVAGNDTITATADGGSNPSDTAAKRWVAAAPATLDLQPATDTNPVDTQHCVTATVRDAFGNPTPNVRVRFDVSGSVTTSGSALTDVNGQAQFCYNGPALPGADSITAYADTDNDSINDAAEPEDDARKFWVLPASTAGCKVTYGGRITAANGDKATFGGNAQADGLSGEEQYQDHGPAQPMNVHSINVLSVVCKPDGTAASIFGRATIDGSGTFDYRIDLQDLGEPGKTDTYRIRLSNGYDSGVKVLNQGNVQIHL
jgi:hypothetical protein